ncbi:hypothetical protein [Nibribacter koreensis]|uniref:SprB repeat-containing protein n=1 Tax=Nibribacter koreensis TaxID=1084519 RepID=A0ABP8FB04_9BACT
MALILLKTDCFPQGEAFVPTHIYWDTETLQTISFQDPESPTCSPYDRPIGEVIDAVCIANTTTRRVYTYAGEGLVSYTDTPDSPFCGYVPPCNLRITGVDIASPDPIGSATGTGQVLTTGADGLIEYSLDGLTWQDSDTFTGLAKGEYTAYAREKDNTACQASFLFEIIEGLALRHFKDFDDLDSVPVSLKLYQRGYTGAPEEFNCLVPSITLSYADADKDKFAGVLGSQLSLSIYSTLFQYRHLYEGDERTYRLELHRDGQLMNVFWLLMDGYRESLAGGTNQISIVATDGLGALKGVPYPLPLETQYGTFLEVVQTCLNELEYQLPLYIGLSLYTDGMVAEEAILNGEATPAYNVLGQAQILLEALRTDKGEALDCHAVLEAICAVFGARLSQSMGAWHFQRIAEQVKDLPLVRVEGGTHTFVSRETPVTILPTGNTLPFFLSGASLETGPVYKEQKVEFDFGGVANLIKYPPVPDSSWNENDTLKGWTFTAPYKRILEGKDKNLLQVDNYVPSPTGAGYARAPRFEVFGTPESHRLRFWYRPVFNEGTVLDPDGAVNSYPRIYLTVKLNESYWLDNYTGSLNTVWQPAETLSFVVCQPQGADDKGWLMGELDFGTVPESGMVEVTFFQIVGNAYAPLGFQLRGVEVISGFGSGFIGESPVVTNELVLTGENAGKLTYKPEVKNVLFGDTLNLLRNTYAHYHGTILVNGEQPYDGWTELNGTEDKPLLAFLLRDILDQYKPNDLKAPPRILTGTLRGLIPMHRTALHVHLEGYAFQMQSLEYNLRDAQASVKLIEIGYTDPESLVTREYEHNEYNAAEYN